MSHIWWVLAVRRALTSRTVCRQKTAARATIHRQAYVFVQSTTGVQSWFSERGQISGGESPTTSSITSFADALSFHTPPFPQQKKKAALARTSLLFTVCSHNTAAVVYVLSVVRLRYSPHKENQLSLWHILGWIYWGVFTGVLTIGVPNYGVMVFLVPAPAFFRTRCIFFHFSWLKCGSLSLLL